MTRTLLICFLCVSLFSCKENNYLPKAIAYPRIILPELHEYKSFDASCPYTFEYPDYAIIVEDSFYFEDRLYSACWINVVYPSLNAKIHISYKEIGKDISLEKVMEDSHELAYTHTKKADYIDEYEVSNKYGVEGLMTNIGGDAANNLQFYLSDYKQHYLRGALYFESHPNADSLQPALNFIREDMLHIFESFQWQQTN